VEKGHFGCAPLSTNCATNVDIARPITLKSSHQVFIDINV